MTTSIWVRDILSFSVQVAIVIGAGAALARIFRLRDPWTGLAYWRTLLIACLLLPLIQPWVPKVAPTFEGARRVETANAAFVSTPPIQPTTAPGLPSTERVVLMVLGSGIAARGLWLLLGAYSLRRLRRGASPIDPVPEPILDAQRRVGATAAILLSDRITGPITFGLFKPVVMLPPGILTMESAVQQAIAYHELLHVRRRDWLDALVEEAIRMIFWFHPGVWWLIGRIQLSREQVVDQAAIELTESRERYVEALLAVAMTQSRITFRPAAAFLRRRLLKKRVDQIMQETTMSTPRLIASLTVSAAALALVTAGAIRSFPMELRASGQEQPRGVPGGLAAPIHIVKGGEHLMHGGLPEYPRAAIKQRIEGEVLLDVTVDQKGEVSDARVLSGPDELRRASLESVLRWHYSPAALRSTSLQVALQFHLPAGPNAEFEKAEILYKPSDYKALAWEIEPEKPSDPKRVERQMIELENALKSTDITDSQRDELKHKYAEVRQEFEHGWKSPFTGTPRLVDVRIERVPEASVKEILSRAGVNIGDAIDEDTAKRISKIASTIDEHLRLSFEGDGKGGMILMIIAP
jgi:TonB family protein